jgi:hypothetical protein
MYSKKIVLMRTSVYIETSVISYYTNRVSKDLVIAARQKLTRTWWNNYFNKAEVYISNLVIEEAQAGDTDAAQRRLNAIAGVPVLELNEQALNLAGLLATKGPIPEAFFDDALHIAIAAVNGIHFILTWNFHHINNPHIRSKIVKIVQNFGYKCPIICSPDEFMEGLYED